MGERLVTKAPEGTWTLMLEDDTKPVRGLSYFLVNDALGRVPDEADEVFLDDRHCHAPLGGPPGVLRGRSLHQYAFGATAFAITPAAARALLEVNFTFANDHSLNVPVRDGVIAAYCPGEPLFLHEYPHKS